MRVGGLFGTRISEGDDDGVDRSSNLSSDPRNESRSSGDQQSVVEDFSRVQCHTRRGDNFFW